MSNGSDPNDDDLLPRLRRALEESRATQDEIEVIMRRLRDTNRRAETIRAEIEAHLKRLGLDKAG